MTLNLDKNRDALIASWKEVLDEKCSTNWVLFGYDGLTFDLNLVAKGDGSLEELADEFNSGKIQYALARVKIQEKNVEKIVLINWQGEGAPLSRKGMCANHIGIVRTFFKGIHVTMNARTEEEVDPDIVIQTVAKAVAGEGVKVSQSQDVDAPVGPVGTCYKKTDPRKEINSLAKDEFWKKEEQEEERRKREEQNKLRRFSQNEVKLLRRESQDYFNESTRNENLVGQSNTNNGANKLISPTTNVQCPNGKINGSVMNGGVSSSKEISSASAAAVKASTPLKNNTSSDLVRQRIRSFDNGQPTGTAFNNGTNEKSNECSSTDSESLSVLKRRQLFESGGASNTVSSAQRRNPALEIKEAQQKIGSNDISTPSAVPTQVQHSSSHTGPALTPAAAPVLEEKVMGCGGIQRSVSPQTSPAVGEIPPTPIVSKPLSRSVESPVRSPIPPAVSSSPLRASPVPPPHSAPSPPHPQIAAPPGFEDSVEGQPESLEQTETITIEITPEMGLCARALYDYQAADDTEITFDPGEIITNIERIDEGWWEGLGPKGVYGLFPANYVELLN